MTNEALAAILVGGRVVNNEGHVYERVSDRKGQPGVPMFRIVENGKMVHNRFSITYPEGLKEVKS